MDNYQTRTVEQKFGRNSKTASLKNTKNRKLTQSLQSTPHRLSRVNRRNSPKIKMSRDVTQGDLFDVAVNYLSDSHNDPIIVLRTSDIVTLTGGID